MTYTGYFSDIKGKEYTVTFTASSIAADAEITLSDNACIITQNGGELYAPIKPNSCTVSITTGDVLSDIYAVGYNDVEVTVTNTTDNVVIFSGYAVPQQYNQNYRWLNSVEIECVSRLSALKNIEYSGQTNLCNFYTLMV